MVSLNIRRSMVLLHEDEIRGVAVGCAEVGLAGGLEIAFARKREDGPEGTAVPLGLPLLRSLLKGSVHRFEALPCPCGSAAPQKRPNDWANLPGRVGER